METETVFHHGMGRYGHLDWYVLLEIAGCGEAWSPVPADKALDDNDSTVSLAGQHPGKYFAPGSWAEKLTSNIAKQTGFSLQKQQPLC